MRSDKGRDQEFIKSLKSSQLQNNDLQEIFVAMDFQTGGEFKMKNNVRKSRQ